MGPPYDLAILRGDGGVTLPEFRVTEDSPLLARLREVWERNILNAVGQLPDVGLSELRAADGRGPD